MNKTKNKQTKNTIIKPYIIKPSFKCSHSFMKEIDSFSVDNH